VNDWRNFHYVIASAPGQCPFDLHNVPAARIEMIPQGQWIIMADADACFVAMAGAQGMIATPQANCFDFVGNRPNFDDWMAMYQPEVTYRWRDDFVIGFADDRTRQAFNTELGGRVVLYTHLQTA
jgi:hypothetical protein